MENDVPHTSTVPSDVLPSAHEMNAELQSIVVNAPVSEVYRWLLRFGDSPRFITSITKVDKISDTQFSCTCVIGGDEIITDVIIMMRVPDRRIAWQTTSDYFRLGVVFLDPLLGGTTKVTVKVRSVVEPVMLTALLHQYLRSFKRLVEDEVSR